MVGLDGGVFVSKKILLIVTSHATLGNTGKPTGLYLPELAHPYEVFIQAGFDVKIASPLGGEAPVAPESISEELKKYLPLVENTIALNKVNPHDFEAYMVVGGHGTMWDLPGNAELQRILPQAYAQDKVVAAVCHGPAALVGLKNIDGQPMIQNKKVTAFTNDEEDAAGVAAAMPFLLETELKNNGGTFIHANNWAVNVVVDGTLVTGQNPASAKGVAEAIVDLLDN